MINKMGFKREDLYLTSIVKCRPPADRQAKEEELEAVSPLVGKAIGFDFTQSHRYTRISGN